MARILADLFLVFSVSIRAIRPIRVQKMLYCFPSLAAKDNADGTDSRGSQLCLIRVNPPEPCSKIDETFSIVGGATVQVCLLAA